MQWTPSGSDGLADIGFLMTAASRRFRAEGREVDRPKERKKNNDVELLPVCPPTNHPPPLANNLALSSSSSKEAGIDFAFVCSQVRDNIICELSNCCSMDSSAQVCKVLRCLEHGYHREGMVSALGVGCKRPRAELPPRRGVRNLWPAVTTRLLQRGLDGLPAAVAGSRPGVTPTTSKQDQVTTTVKPDHASTLGRLRALCVVAQWILCALAEDGGEENLNDASSGMLPPRRPVVTVAAHDVQPLLYTLRDAAESFSSIAREIQHHAKDDDDDDDDGDVEDADDAMAALGTQAEACASASMAGGGPEGATSSSSPALLRKWLRVGAQLMIGAEHRARCACVRRP
jgi:hypothetical protein